MTPDLLEQYWHYKEDDEKDDSSEETVALSDGSLRDLLEGTRNMRNLTQLIMTLQGCKRITDSGLVAFQETLPKLQSLQMLRIDVSMLPLITDSGLKSLSQGIGKTHCDGIAIVCDGNVKITDKGISNIVETIRGNEYKAVRFSFLGCSALTSQSVKILFESLKNDFQGLRSIYIGFSGAPGIKNDAMSCFVNIIEDLKTLNKYHPIVKDVGFPTGPLTPYSEFLIKELKKLELPERNGL